ncbi:MAG: NAD-binding protein [Methanomicrobiales archaeon]|nr:NAD-binding protein [Methanomicrobiales archaeon]
MSQEAGSFSCLVCGCGSVGFLILERLRREHITFTCLDNDPARVKELREQNYEALCIDIIDKERLSGLGWFNVVFFVSDSHEVNLSGVLWARKALPSAHVIARANDPINKVDLLEAGADFVIYPQEIIANTAYSSLEQLRCSGNSSKLIHILEQWTGTLGIVLHTNPDPDGISCGLALAELAHIANPDLHVQLLYDGVIGYQENRALVNILELKLERLTPKSLTQCEYIALVDSGGPGINNGLSRDTPVHIIIDHHNEQQISQNAAFIDIRPRYGACASILTEYIKALNITPDPKLATALLYGIRTDTKDFHRNLSPNDLMNAAFLLQYADAELLEKIMFPQYSYETMDILGHAILHRKTRSGYLFSNVGYVRNRDALPQAADMLLSLEGISTAIVYGITDEAIIMSGRNRDVRLNLGTVMSETFGAIGDAGGHATMAAASIPLSIFSLVRDKEVLLDLVIEPLLQNLYRQIGLLEENVEQK